MTPEATFVFFGLLSAAFGLVYFPVLNRLARGFISPYAKADIRKRAGAGAIDATLVLICLVGLQTQGSLLFLLVGAVYLLLRDALFVGTEHRQVLLGLVSSISTPAGMRRMAAAKRNFIFIVPGLNIVAAGLEAVATLRDPQGQRLGDRIANTHVIEGLGAKEFVKGVRQAMVEIEFKRNPEKQPVEVK